MRGTYPKAYICTQANQNFLEQPATTPPTPDALACLIKRVDLDTNGANERYECDASGRLINLLPAN